MSSAGGGQQLQPAGAGDRPQRGGCTPGSAPRGGRGRGRGRGRPPGPGRGRGRSRSRGRARGGASSGGGGSSSSSGGSGSGSSSGDEDEDEEDERAAAGGWPARGGDGGGDDEEEDEDDDAAQPGGQYFGGGVDVDTLLAGMAAPTPGDGSGLQPYQVLRAQRRAAASAAPAARRRQEEPSDAASEDWDAAEEDQEEDEGEGEQDDGGEGPGWGAGAPRLRHSVDHVPARKRKRRRGGRGPRAMELPEHVSRMVGHANLLYASNKYQQAADLLLEVIRQAPNLADPYYTLGALHEVLRQPRQALSFYIIAAHMAGKDVALWHKLAQMSEEQGFTRQAIYCWSKVLAKHKDDLDARSARARLYVAVNEPWRARQQFLWLLERHPGHPQVVKDLVMLYFDQGQPDRAIEVLEGQLREHYAQVDLTHINMLADLYMGMGHYANAAALINRSEQVMCQDEPLPIDLVVRRGACYAHTGDVANAAADLRQLLQHPVMGNGQDSYQDLYFMVVQEAAKAGMQAIALPFADALAAAPGALEAPDQWRLLAGCFVSAGRRPSAAAFYSSLTQRLGLGDQRYLGCALALAQLHADGGDRAAAEALLSHLDEALEAHALTLPEGRAQQLSLFLDKAQLQLRLGQRQAFAASMLPHVSSLLDRAESNVAIVAAANQASGSGALPRDLVRALKRRRMLERKGGRKGEGGGEVDSVFVGYVSRDRRKPHILEADRAAEQLIRRARATGGGGASETEPDDDDGAAGGAGEGEGGGGDVPAEIAAVVAAATAEEELPDLFADRQLFGCFVDLVHVLADLGREGEAAALLSRATAVAAAPRSGKDWGAQWGAGGAAAQPGGRGRGRGRGRRGGARGGGGEEDGGLSDWGDGGGASGAAPAALSAAERREQSRLLREGLKLMSAEVASRQGQPEVALKLLKTVLPKWPYSWRAWSLYCCVCSQLGRVQHWMKAVAALRAKHPDSLALQVLSAHADAVSGEHAAACGAYASALLQLPDEPLLLLCLGSSLVDLALSRGCKDRNASLLRGFAALHSYAASRGPDAEAEAAYNLGRAAHQVGLLHVAVVHYERVLQLADEAEAAAAEAAAGQRQPGGEEQGEAAAAAAADDAAVRLGGLQLGAGAGEGAGWQQQQQRRRRPPPDRRAVGLGLSREAAHNLAAIYRGSGADELARQVMRRYLTL